MPSMSMRVISSLDGSTVKETPPIPIDSDTVVPTTDDYITYNNKTYRVLQRFVTFENFGQRVVIVVTEL